MKSLKKYLSVYKEFFSTSFTEGLSFRTDFSLQVLMNLAFMCTYFLTADFIFNHIEKIGFWNRMEFFFFLSFVFTVDQIHFLTLSHNFWGFSRDVRLGNLDFHLLKPISAFFIVFSRRLAVSGLVTTAISCLLMIYFGMQAGLTPMAWIALPFCIVASLFLLFGIEVLISLFNFITIAGDGVNQARLQIQHFLRWPDFIYKTPFRLWMFPFLAVTSIPVKFLLEPNDWPWQALLILGTLCLWAFIARLWPKAVKLYESPSS